MKKILITLLASAAVVSVPAYAGKSVISTEMANRILPGNCDLKETVTLAVNFNRKVRSFSEAKTVIDEQMKKVNELAEQQQIKPLVIQSQSQNVSAQPTSYLPDGTPDNYNYNVNGNVSYMIKSADAAYKFAEFLTQQKMQVSLSSNAYRSGNCQ